MSEEKRESINIDEDINQAIEKAVQWMVERDIEKVSDLVMSRTTLTYSREMVELKVKEYVEKNK